jgi:hypothetical protein
MTNFDQVSHFDCDCQSAEHIFRVTSEDAWDPDFPPDLFLTLQLNQYRSVFKRFITAVKYLFGYECRFGHWDVVTINQDDLNRLIVLFQQHRIKLENHSIQKEKKKQNEQ